MKTKVLVTGGCGFIGRELVKQLLKKKYDVTVIDDFSNSSPIKETSARIIKFDLTKDKGLTETLRKADYCIHLAASTGGIKFMNSSQSQILRNNLLIDENIMKGANLVRMKKIVYASSAIVYDKVKEFPYREIPTIDLLQPKSIYGLSKLIGERLLQVYNQDDGVNFTIARIFNVYGINPNSIPEKKLHVIPDLIRKISKMGKLQLIGGGRQTRTFIHVSDVASALILMMESQSANGEIFNVASDEKYQILELAKIIWGLLKGKEPFYAENLDFKGTDLISSLGDNSKINKLLGWKAKRNLKDSLPKIVEWYREKL